MTRRYWLMALAAGIMVAAVAAQKRPANQPSHSFRISFGLKDEKPAEWNGKVEVTDGEVASLEGWRFEAKDEVADKTGWKCSTHEYIAPGERYKLETPGEPLPKPKLKPWPNGVDVALRGDKPSVVVSFAQGKVEFTAKSHQQALSRVGLLPEREGSHPDGRARWAGRRVVGTDRSGRSGRSFSRRHGEHA